MKINKDNLIEQLKSKNPKALDYIVDVYGNLLYKSIYSVLNSYGDKGIMDECLNDVLLSIWNNSNMFLGNSQKFVHWICVIAKYKAIDYQRKFVRNREVVDINNYMIQSDLTTEDKVLANENRKEIIGYINELDGISKKIFIMRFLLEENINDIAQKLGVSRNVVDTRLFRGKRMLKERITSVRERENYNEKYI